MDTFYQKKNKLGLNKVLKFIEKPNRLKAKQIINKKGYWNSGMFFVRKDSVIHNFKNIKKIPLEILSAVKKAKLKKDVYFLHKKNF